MKIPKACFGVKCMQKDCQNLASHKIGEENIWSSNDEDEKERHEEFKKRHNWTTYLCSTHFMNIMNRDTSYFNEDKRFDGLEKILYIVV